LTFYSEVSKQEERNFTTKAQLTNQSVSPLNWAPPLRFPAVGATFKNTSREILWWSVSYSVIM